MSRNRLTVVASAVVVAAGAAIALGALYAGNAQAAVGPLPADALVLPGDARFVVGVDVRRFVASPLYRKMAEASREAGRPAPFQELEEKTGLNPERDLESVYVAGRHGAGPREHGGGVVIVTGTFDRYKLQRAIETSGRAAPGTRTIQGVTVYVHDEARPGGHAAAVGFLEDNLLVMGSLPDVGKVITARVTGQGGIRGNAAMVALLEQVRPGSTFWAVGDQSMLDRMPKGVPGPGGAGALQLPGLTSVLVTADLDPEVHLEVTGQAADEASAKNLADVVRGLVALAQLQSGQKPELKQLATAVSVTTEAERVHVKGRFPYELIDALQVPARKKAIASADAE